MALETDQNISYEFYAQGKAKLIVREGDSYSSFIIRGKNVEYLGETASAVAEEVEASELGTPEERHRDEYGDAERLWRQ